MWSCRLDWNTRRAAAFMTAWRRLSWNDGMPASVAFPKSSFVSTNAAIRDETGRPSEAPSDRWSVAALVYESSVKRFARLGHAIRILTSESRKIPKSRTTCCWVRKTNLRAKRNFTWGRRIHRSSVSQIIHKVLHLKCYKKRLAQQLTEGYSMHALFSVCGLRDNNEMASKHTWKLKHANSILEPSEYFCQISSKSIHIISSYTVSKLDRFLRHSV